jgi:hypothetical protein
VFFRRVPGGIHGNRSALAGKTLFSCRFPADPEGGIIVLGILHNKFYKN